METRIIHKEDAVFWMDKDGIWHNKHGRFEHPKLIRFFHASIQKDDHGYFVHQKTDEFEEKVYFRYEDTAIFVFDIQFDRPPDNKTGDQMVLCLNNGEKKVLDPEQLFQKDDALYVVTPEHWIKFTQKTLVKLSRHITEKEGVLWLTLQGNAWRIKSSLDGKTES